MNAGAIWWGQIGNSLRILTRVTNNLRYCRSAVLQVPRSLPWTQDFYDAVDVRRLAFSAERRLLRLQWEEGADPGEFVLEELCSAPVRAEYWPGQTYGEYLGSLEDIALNDYYVWITGVRSKADLVRWTEFIAQYDRAARRLSSYAVFIIEYTGPTLEQSPVEQIIYTVENYDCRVFCLELAAACNNTDMHNYQAELALSLGSDDPELCSALIELGGGLLDEPIRATERVLQMRGLAQRPEQEIVSAAWKAAIVLLFPVLEQYRMRFVVNNKDLLARNLPITNSNGDRVTDPFDLELGSLCYITGTGSKEFKPGEVEHLRLCRKVRNLLAHNKVVPYEDVRRIMSKD